MLISTRNPSEEASAYCFPSKIFEYMVSGNPVISTKIKGIPDEYFDYLTPINSVNNKEIAKAILTISNMSFDEIRTLGLKGKKFVISEKNNVVQSKKIIDFIS